MVVWAKNALYVGGQSLVPVLHHKENLSYWNKKKKNKPWSHKTKMFTSLSWHPAYDGYTYWELDQRQKLSCMRQLPFRQKSRHAFTKIRWQTSITLCASTQKKKTNPKNVIVSNNLPVTGKTYLKTVLYWPSPSG